MLFLGSLLGTLRSAIDQFFSLSLVTVPEVFAKVNSIQFPLRFLSGAYVIFIPCDFGAKMSQCYTEWHYGTVLGRPILTQFTAQLSENQKSETVSLVVPNFKIRAVN